CYMDKVVQYLKRYYIRIKYYRYGWRGNYSSWQEAHDRCTGYHAANIIEKIKAATLRVKNGEAAYERDAVLYDKVEFSWPLLANLLWIAGTNENCLSVLDFGGSMGTSYFQNRSYLAALTKLSWNVVEQPGFVATARKEIAGDALDFFETIEDSLAAKGSPTVIRLSCVLPYIEKPYVLLKEITSKKIPYIIIENTYFNRRAANRLTIQKVPPVYYEASYPAWFLNYDEVLMTLSENYDLTAAYNNEQFLYLDGRKIMYQGCVMHLKELADN
ncbi:MAG: methyltransferase, TIGR04325 family, partial [Bacteroidota bacterium]